MLHLVDAQVEAGTELKLKLQPLRDYLWRSAFVGPGPGPGPGPVAVAEIPFKLRTSNNNNNTNSSSNNNRAATSTKTTLATPAIVFMKALAALAAIPSEAA